MAVCCAQVDEDQSVESPPRLFRGEAQLWAATLGLLTSLHLRSLTRPRKSLVSDCVSLGFECSNKFADETNSGAIYRSDDKEEKEEEEDNYVNLHMIVSATSTLQPRSGYLRAPIVAANLLLPLLPHCYCVTFCCCCCSCAL